MLIIVLGCTSPAWSLPNLPLMTTSGIASAMPLPSMTFLPRITALIAVVSLLMICSTSTGMLRVALMMTVVGVFVPVTSIMAMLFGVAPGVTMTSPVACGVLMVTPLTTTW